METTVNERIMLLKSELGLTTMDFCSKAKISTGTFQNIKIGENINQKTLNLIIQNLNVNKDWLMNGKGKMFIETPKTPINETNPWKDALVEALNNEIKELRAKHSQAMDMMAKMIDHLQVGKLKAFDLTASNPKGKFASRAAA